MLYLLKLQAHASIANTRSFSPWALALGTPVLVVAGIGHAVHGAVHKRVKRVRSMSRGRRGGAASASANSSSARLETSGDLPMSREYVHVLNSAPSLSALRGKK